MPEEYKEYDEYEEYDDEEDDGYCSPSKCGACWGGDGICMAEIEQQAAEYENYRKRYVAESIPCPSCRVPLTRYAIPNDTLWVWPGQWPNGEHYSPIIALDIFAVLDAQKGEVHPAVTTKWGTYHHIWVGTGECRSEKLILLSGAKASPEAPAKEEPPAADGGSEGESVVSGSSEVTCAICEEETRLTVRRLSYLICPTCAEQIEGADYGEEGLW